jgi:elongation factor Ts
MIWLCRWQPWARSTYESDVEEGDSRPVAQVSLLQQPFIKDNSSSVGEVLREVAAKLGENVRVLRFSRLALGE